MGHVAKKFISAFPRYGARAVGRLAPGAVGARARLRENYVTCYTPLERGRRGESDGA